MSGWVPVAGAAGAPNTHCKLLLVLHLLRRRVVVGNGVELQPLVLVQHLLLVVEELAVLGHPLPAVLDAVRPARGCEARGSRPGPTSGGVCVYVGECQRVCA